MSAKLLNLLAVSSLVILACSFGPAPVNALSLDSSRIHARSHGHAALANQKRGSSSAKRCKSRPTTTSGKASTTPASKSSSQGAPKAVTSKAPPPTTSSAPPSGGGTRKVGLGWANDDDAALRNMVTKNVGPIITWSPWIPDIAKELGLIPCPMLWGPKQISQFQQLVVPGYANVAMGMNEPNQQGQSDLDPTYAAQLWKQYIQPLKKDGYALITPACTNAPSGITWMQAFFKACDGCTFDGLALHWYGTDPQEFISYLQQMHSTFNMPIWPTEFACQNFSGGAQCTSSQVFSFMSTVKNFMDNTEWVPYYFAFGALFDMGNVNPLNQLMNAGGTPTDLGNLYLN